MTFFVGVDPGSKGAIAVVSNRGPIALRSFHKSMDLAAILAIEDTINAGLTPYPWYWAIEKPITVRGNSVRSVAMQWASYGSIVGVATHLSGESFIQTPEPALWKKAMGVTADKKTSIKMVLDEGWATEADLYASERARTLSADRAEAILLAHYCQMLYAQGGFS